MEPATVPLVYTIASATPHSGSYRPENIMVDKPQDHTSRWSGAFQGANQWITLRLEPLAVLTSITFGKFSKPHPCNIKDLKVYIGLTEDDISEVLHATLKNDSTPETFLIPHSGHSEVACPTRFVKIVPLQAHGHQRFHTSIWHVALHGISDPQYVESVKAAYEECRESVALRHILKHLRQRRLLTPYQAILSRTNIQLEHPLVTQLHQSLVLQGNWARSERLVEQLGSAGVYNDYLRSHQLSSIWTRLAGTDDEGDVPPARGGHAMCMDPVNEMIYIFGGWNGEKSLDDFWVYNVREDKWRCLTPSTSEEQNAPGARSCHKMVFDTKTGNIYILGRLNDTDEIRPSSTLYVRNVHGTMVAASSHPQSQVLANGASPSDSTLDTTSKSYCSEFYRYHTRGLDKGKWDFLSFDTHASGGPPLVFDHQMVMDPDTQMLYVFGGRVLDGNWDNIKYSGLYSYDVRHSKWKLLQNPEHSHGSQISIPPRFGHSMVLDSRTKTLYILAGQRGDEYLSDMYTYDIRTGATTELFSNFSAVGGPEACFMQRSVIDPVLKEIYVFCGLTRKFPNSPHNTLGAFVSNWMYRYEKQPGQWCQIVQESERPLSELPVPRFAHQVVYDPFSQTVFVHGGNAGGPMAVDKPRMVPARNADGDEAEEMQESGKGKDKRLDDFWKMQLKRPSVEQVVRQAKFLIRRQQFREMCEKAPPVKALHFLQTQVSSVVDHTNPQETGTFRSLLTHLLCPSPPSHSSLDPPLSFGFPNTASSSSSSSLTSLEHEDIREGSTRPRKRSKASLKDDDDGKSEDGAWTNEIPSTSDGGNLHHRPLASNIQRIRDMVDPLEEDVVRESTDHEETESKTEKEEGERASLPSGARYTQRTQVFEELLKFISDEAKQPSEDLLDLLDKSHKASGAGGGSS